MVWNRRGLKGLFDKLIEIWCWCWYGVADRIRLCNARRNSIGGDLVSIIMPTIGRDATKAIQSVLNQTYKNWELIIIYDGLFQYCSGMEDVRINWWTIPKKLHYPDQPIYHWLVGPVNAINYGLSKVRGAWIARIDDDDEWETDHLKVALKYALGFNREFASFNIDLNGKVPDPYNFYGKRVGAVQTWLYKSYLNCFKCSKHSWQWRPGSNDVDLPKRMARAGVRMVHWSGIHATVKPRPGLTETGKKGWEEECLQKKLFSR